MNFYNIKFRITLWYTVFMITLVGGILGILVEFTDTTLLSNQKNKLVEVVEDISEDIKEEDDFDYFDDGIYIMIYNGSGKYLTGSIPLEFPISFQLEAGQVQELKEGDRGFYIYDKKVVTDNEETLWIRGIFSDVELNKLTLIIIKGAFLVLPPLVTISLFIGYFITKRAFLPVKKIQETAQNITQSNELSLRIGVPEGKDEISKLANTIDVMLERLDNSFQKEKQFTSDASHELRTPVSVILAESEYILQHGETLEEAKESMEIINRQAEKISALINQLLLFSRAERGELKLKLEKVNIPEVIEELKNDNILEAEKKDITISYIDKLERKSFDIDKLMFIRAIQNTLQNGITYGKVGGKIEIETFEESEYFAVKIKDDGIGIAKENLEKIWNRFFQVDEARSSKGMGLGLSMVKLIVEKHKGYVKVDSELGVGTLFILYFNKNLRESYKF